MRVAGRLALQVARQTADLGDAQLPGDMLDHGGRHRDGVGQEAAEKPHRQQLQGEAEPIGIAAVLADQVAVGVIEVEEARQLGGGDRLRVTAIAALRRRGQKIDGHRGVSTNDRLMRRPETSHANRETGPILSHLSVS